MLAMENATELLRILQGFPEGASLNSLLAVMPPMNRRTAQRRLKQLEQEGLIQAQGEGRSRRYLAQPPAVTPTPALPAAYPVDLSLSPDARDTLALIRRPRGERPPTGYQVACLEAYQPNHSRYLSPELCGQLHDLGRSPDDRQPAGTFAQHILDRLLIDLSWASSRLEGNTYSRLDTERLLNLGQIAEGKDALETQMILNHKAAIEYLVHQSRETGVNRETLIALHALLSDGLMADPQSCGRLRRRAVEIGGSVYLPLALPSRIEELFGLVVEMAAEIRVPFEQAFFLMVHLPYLQPFEDVNKRVSRLAANIPLFRANLSPLSFIDVPELAYVEGMLAVYELNRVDLLRDVFVWAYARSCQQYVAVRSQLTPPDTFRLRYRLALAEAVCRVVRGGQAATEAVVRQCLPAGVKPEDEAAFVRLVLEEFKHLHAGNAVRFGLGALELEAWRAGQDAVTPP